MTTIRTKYTDVEIPGALADVTLKIMGEHPSRDGVAFSAEVHKDGRVVGIIENQGNGGGTWFYNHTFTDRQWWDSMVKEFAALPSCEFPTLADEHLADTLYDDAALKRDLDRKRSPIARFRGDNDDIRQFRGKVDAELRQGLINLGTRDGIQIELWIKGKGWETLCSAV